VYILLVLTPVRDTYHTYASPILPTMETVAVLSKQYPSSLLYTICLNKRARIEYLELKVTVPSAEVNSLITLKHGG